MRFLVAILLGLSLMSTEAPVARAAQGWTPPPDPRTALILANAYGDSAWFESDSLLLGPGVAPEGWKPRAADSLLRHITLRTSTRGPALVVACDSARGAWEPDSALLARLDSGFDPLMSSMLPDQMRSPAFYQVGCFDNRSMRWPCGRQFAFWLEPGPPRVGPRPPLRLTIIAQGSTPARIVGEVILDFGRRLLVPQRVEGCSVVMGAARPW